MRHKIKITEKYHNDIWKSVKRFEIRKNDRNYKIGDIIEFEIVSNKGEKTFKGLTVQIKYIFYGGEYGLDKDYCIFCW